MLIKERIDYLEEYIRKCINKDKAFPAASFGIITKKESYFGAIGKTLVGDLERNIDFNTIFDLASLTKVVATNTAIMKLVEDGMLSLSDDIIDILPRYKYRGIKISDLLTHTAGYDPEPDYKGCRKREELIELLYNEKIDSNKIKKEVIYSDTGFMLLSLIIERLTGSFEEYTKEKIFKPLKMTDTGFNPSKEKRSRCAATEKCSMRGELVIGVVHDEKSYIMGGVSGHAGLFSTVKDLGFFVQMILDGGEYQGKRILSKNTIDLLSKCQTEGLNRRRGYGWILKEKNSSIGDFVSELAIYHTGFTGTSILIDRHYGIGFILLSNRVHPTRENIKLLSLRGKINNIAMTTI
ncbi:serine hydrolase [Wukongibacter baidiensis]|uniref:serine hydrolase domain-containing protein n=1 Tax=Wukongibacter baidiensis TaxID=1723361 RepID=UPI003D7F6831